MLGTDPTEHPREPSVPQVRSSAMNHGIEGDQESAIDYFYFENGYYHRVRVADVRETTEDQVLLAA
jgi:hypothetical protein